MQLSAAIFNDPTQRAGLQKYYEHKKTELIDSLKAREADPAFQATVSGEIKMPDGTTKTINGTLMTAEMAEKALVSFDKWMETVGDIYEMQTRHYEMAQKNLEMLQAQNPDSPSGVRSTFSRDGMLLAYINEDGSIVTTNGADRYLKKVIDKANNLNLTGQARADYLHREVQAALSKHFDDLDVDSYNKQMSPSKREFADMWYTNFDIDQHYRDALAEAKASLEGAREWRDQMQKNLNEMQAFLLGLQEAESPEEEIRPASFSFEKSEALVTESVENERTAADEFLEFMDMSTEERYLALLLGDKDMTKEQFDALPPEEKEKIMEEVRERIRADLEKKTGIAAPAVEIAA